MPTYKLTYFNLRALGEGIRMLFAEAGVDFEDKRFSGDQWPQIKEELGQLLKYFLLIWKLFYADPLWGQVPELEVDGVKLYQSSAIGRFLARRFGIKTFFLLKSFFV